MRRAALALALLLAGPAWADTPARPTREQTLDRLLGMLKVAPDEQTAAAVETSISAQWLAEATPAAKLLLQHGLASWASTSRRGAGRFRRGAGPAARPAGGLARPGHGPSRTWATSAGALRDIAETLKREPRQFEALQDLSRIAEQRGDWRGAYEAWRQALALDPKTPGGTDRLNDLQRRAFGDPT